MYCTNSVRQCVCALVCVCVCVYRDWIKQQRADENVMALELFKTLTIQTTTILCVCVCVCLSVWARLTTLVSIDHAADSWADVGGRGSCDHCSVLCPRTDILHISLWKHSQHTHTRSQQHTHIRASVVQRLHTYSHQHRPPIVSVKAWSPFFSSFYF